MYCHGVYRLPGIGTQQPSVQENSIGQHGYAVNSKTWLGLYGCEVFRLQIERYSNLESRL